MTVFEVIFELLRHPVRSLIKRWNWKSAFFSSCFRAVIFFSTNLAGGLHAALGAMTIEFIFRATTSGFYGAVTQSLRRAEPAWAASIAAMLLVPAVTHSLEFLVHWVGGTRKLFTSIVVSACFSALSTLFNLFAMRRGALVVGEGGLRLVDDVKRFPGILREFVLFLPLGLWRRIKLRGLRRRSPFPASESGKAREERFAD